MADAAWVALSLIKHVGGKTLRALLTHFDDDPNAILRAEPNALRAVPGVGAKIAAAIQQVDVVQTARAIERWQAAGVHIVTWRDADYPRTLHDLDDAPPTLFMRGAWRFENDHPYLAAALVGTRTPTLASRIAVNQFASDFARRKLVLVSGLALGIDTVAHQAALSHDGTTLAVLGGGILNIYPPQNRALAAQIMERGALLCEVQPDAAVSASGLVARNRIITGLCDRVIIVETESDGGAMHAARFATMQGRALYALVNDASGNRQLLNEGAQRIYPPFSAS
ncbi:MAG: DNA-processing protein DprA [Armatimonadetes bacterium]|nr:DNA-processing protein DprA [Anaerolineae bacterium]